VETRKEHMLHHLPDAILYDLLQLAGIAGPARATLIQRHNHVYRVTVGREVFFLKTFTKDWYGDDVPGTGYCVAHEADAWAVLARHGLAVPEVLLACRDTTNPLGRPCLLTRALPGTSLTTLLVQANEATFRRLLETTGAYLHRIHAITFAYPGYIVGDGPSAPPDAGAWQHPIWSAAATQRAALAMLERDRARLSPTLTAALARLFAGMDTALAAAFTPPRFAHGDCHAGGFFLAPAAGGWAVTGVVDMEVASAGDAGADLLKLALELAARFPAQTHWWEPLFAGYGQEPDFAGFQLRLLGRDETEFRAHGPDAWPGSRAAVLRSILAARDWRELFAGRTPPGASSTRP
jgi:aminoglycoside phosphotransferase